MRLKLSIDKDRVAIAEPLHLTIEASAPEHCEVTMPSPGKTLGDWRVRGVRDQPGLAPAGRQQWRQVWEVESFLSGEQTIPPVAIRYRALQGAGQTKPADHAAASATQPASAPSDERELSTEPVIIHVTSALAGDADPADLKHLRDIKGPVDVPLPRSRRWMAWAAGLLLVLSIASGAFLYYRRMLRRRPPPPVEPGAWAFEQFRRLEQTCLIEQGRCAEFYGRLSAIVREYIERRFSLRAPEQTTEEFLRATRGNPVLSEQHQELLQQFLEAADQVKFALYEPSRDEAERAFTAARDFVEETAYVPATADQASSTGQVEQIGNRQSAIDHRP